MLSGNPYTDWYENTYGFVGDVYGHGLMDGPDYDLWREHCWNDEDNIDGAAICSAIYSRAYLSSFNANVYALDWPQCLEDVEWDDDAVRQSPSRRHFGFQKRSHLHRHAQRFMGNVLDHAQYEELGMRMDRAAFSDLYSALKQRHFAGGKGTVSALKALDADLSAEGSYYSISSAVSSGSYVPCIEYKMADWLNLEEVQSALNVKPPQNEWEMCSDAVWDAWPDADYDLFMQDWYSAIIAEYSEALDLKLAIYSGTLTVDQLTVSLFAK